MLFPGLATVQYYILTTYFQPPIVRPYKPKRSLANAPSMLHRKHTGDRFGTASTPSEAQKELRCTGFFFKTLQHHTAADQTSAKQSAAATAATNAHTC